MGIAGARAAHVEVRLAGLTIAANAGLIRADDYARQRAPLAAKRRKLERAAAWLRSAYRPRPGLWELTTVRSQDRGRTWAEPARIEPPLVRPAFEVCHSIVPLRDGRLVWPTSTWMGWDGDAPNGMNGIMLVSEDGGRTWPSYAVDFDRWAEHILHWEQSFLELRDGRWLAVAWAVDLNTNQTLPTPLRGRARRPDVRRPWADGISRPDHEVDRVA